jgi:hypothetical protein
VKTHDCFGSIVRAGSDGKIVFLCRCGRPFAEMDKQGMRIVSRHGNEKDENTIPLRTLKALMKQLGERPE